jgi:hypothetical protein
MNRAWAMSLSPDVAEQLARDYEDLLKREGDVSASIPSASRDAYTEMIGFSARVLGKAGQIFLADRKIQLSQDVDENQRRIEQLRVSLEADVQHFNTEIANGKWKNMMPGVVTGRELARWNSQVRWPWGERIQGPATQPSQQMNQSSRVWRDAAGADRKQAAGAAQWVMVPGLGTSGRAMALKPASLASSWQDSDSKAPTLEFDFTTRGGDSEALIDFLPAFRIYAGMKLRVAVSVDDAPSTLVEVPGSSGSEDEVGRIRSNAVQDNYVRARVPMPELSAGKHVLKIRAVDPGAVVDRVALP